MLDDCSSIIDLHLVPPYFLPPHTTFWTNYDLTSVCSIMVGPFANSALRRFPHNTFMTTRLQIKELPSSNANLKSLAQLNSCLTYSGSPARQKTHLPNLEITTFHPSPFIAALRSPLDRNQIKAQSMKVKMNINAQFRHKIPHLDRYLTATSLCGRALTLISFLAPLSFQARFSFLSVFHTDIKNSRILLR